MGKKVLGVIKKVFGGIFMFFCIVEVVIGIYQMSQGEVMQNMMDIVIAMFLFGVPAFFLLKPNKQNPPNSNLPSNQQSNPPIPTLPPNAQNNPKICASCGKKLGILSTKTIISDGAVCGSCLRKAWVSKLANPQAYNIATLRFFLSRRAALVNSFSPTKKAGAYIDVDENHRLFRIGPDLFEYENLLRFELLESGYVVLAGGLGQAVDGGLFFINRGNLQGNSKSLDLRVTLRNAHIDIAFISFFVSTVQKNSSVYQDAQVNAQSCVYVLQKIVEQVESSARAVQTQAAQVQAAQQAASIVDEMEQLYQLLHSGLITQEDFDAKKRQLLGL